MNDELQRLYEEERQDTRGYEGAESFLAAQGRRALLQHRLHQQPDYLSQAQDFYHAAFLMQHGEELEHWWKAHELALKAVELGEHKARYLVAASLDRYLMRQGQPQKYGTNGVWDEKLGRWRVWDYDPTTTDQERAQWDVPPLVELLARIEVMNQPSNASEKWKKAFAVKTVAGYEILLTNLKGEGSYWGEEVPPYLPLENPASKLPDPLPAGLSFWQFKGVYCARQADGELFLTWQPCWWDPVGEDSHRPEIYAGLSGEIHWLEREENYWQRGLRLVSPETAWLVGAALPRPTLAALVLSLEEEAL